MQYCISVLFFYNPALYNMDVLFWYYVDMVYYFYQAINKNLPVY